MKKLLFLFIVFASLSVVAKPKPRFLPGGGPCGDLKKVTYDVKTKTTKNEATHKMKDDYTITITNNSGVDITATVLMADKNNNGPRAVNVSVTAEEKTKTVNGNYETPKGLNYVRISLKVNSDKCKDTKKKTLVIPQFAITHL